MVVGKVPAPASVRCKFQIIFQLPSDADGGGVLSPTRVGVGLSAIVLSQKYSRLIADPV